jgi:hypothetical protein
MQSINIHQRTEDHGAPGATPRDRSRGAVRDCVAQSQPRRGRWALVQVWDGAVLASFDDEAPARTAMTRIDDDEVVVLYVGR